MGITLEARNYRGLRHVKWSPSGVCALVGPNGSGKTTLLSLFELLRNAYQRGMPEALSHMGGATTLRHFGAKEDEPIVVGLSVGDLTWSVELAVRGGALEVWSGERVTNRTHTLLSRVTGSEKVALDNVGFTGFDARDPRLAVRFGYDQGRTELKPLVTALTAFRVYRHYNLESLRRYGSTSGGDVELHPSGENALTVLRNWHGRREYRPRYEFVIETMRTAFPETFADLDFEQAGQTVSIRLFGPHWGTPYSVFFASNGWLAALLHLLAVAGAEPGALVAIDEIENALHPWAILKLIEAFRDWSDEHDLTICLATHSPVVLREFNQEPEKVFVMEFGQETLPVVLTDLYALDWLRQFSLGDLYAYGEIANQRRESTPAK
jgi:predicted ATPase